MEGRDILLNALKEPVPESGSSSGSGSVLDKGKGKADDNAPAKRRGIVTGESAVTVHPRGDLGR